MNDILLITLIGFFVGIVGTGLGGLISIFIKSTNKIFLSSLLGLTGGFMLSIVTFELLPESYALGGVWTEILGIALGILLIILVDRNIPKEKYDPLLRSGIILSISMGMHNLPEGLAIGSSFMARSDIGMIISLAVLIHNLPEGLALAMPLKISKVSNCKVLFSTILVGIPTGIGAFIGAYLGNISNFFISLCFSFAGGAMLFIICDDLIPNAKALHNGRASTIGLILGFIFGILLFL